MEAKKAIKRLREAMEKVKKVLDDYESKMRTASRLETNLKFISVSIALANRLLTSKSNTLQKQVKDLSTEIGPAIKTLQKLQGAWKSMETDLSAIKDLIEFDTDNIPPMLITRPQLQGIVDEWNELKDYGTSRAKNMRACLDET